TRDRLAARLAEVAMLGESGGVDFAQIVPVSAVLGEQVVLLAELLAGCLPEGPRLYPDGEVTDAPLEQQVAELVREAALDGVREELPHSIAVVVEQIEVRPDDARGPGLAEVQATVFVERDSQKAIVIGVGGQRLRQAGTRARLGIEELLGRRVYLDLRVKVAKEWQRDPRQLRRMGF
ncbi:MAG: GTPase Era, partial [Actinomycetes bacterium]